MIMGGSQLILKQFITYTKTREPLYVLTIVCANQVLFLFRLMMLPAPGNHHISDAPESESASPDDPVFPSVIVFSHLQFLKRHATAPD